MKVLVFEVKKMKKKKLKKKIKKFSKEIAYHRELISNLGDKYTKLRTDLTKLTISVNYQKALYFGFNDAERKDNNE